MEHSDEILFTPEQEKLLQEVFSSPEMEETWEHIRECLIKAIACYRKGSVSEKLQRLLQMYQTDWIEAVRFIRGQVYVLTGCSCGCGDSFWILPKRSSGKLLQPLQRLCINVSGGKAAILKNRAEISLSRYQG